MDFTRLSMFRPISPTYKPYPSKCINHHKALDIMPGDKNEFIKEESFRWNDTIIKSPLDGMIHDRLFFSTKFSHLKKNLSIILELWKKLLLGCY